MTVQTPACDRTKGPVGLSGTVLDTRLVHPRVAGDLVSLVIVIICGSVRAHITRQYECMADATAAKALVPVGSHCSAWGAAAHLSMSHGELHLQTDRVITYHLQSDLPPAERDLFGVVA